MPFDLPQPTVQGIYATCTLIVLWAGWAKLARPRIKQKFRRVNAALDTIGGRDPIVDPVSGKQIAEALPPLGERMAHVEDAVVELRQVVVLLTEVQRTLTDHASRISSLEDGRLERIVGRAESAQAWRAIADRDPDLMSADVLDAEADEPSPEA